MIGSFSTKYAGKSRLDIEVVGGDMAPTKLKFHCSVAMVGYVAWVDFQENPIPGAPPFVVRDLGPTLDEFVNPIGIPFMMQPFVHTPIDWDHNITIDIVVPNVFFRYTSPNGRIMATSQLKLSTQVQDCVMMVWELESLEVSPSYS